MEKKRKKIIHCPKGGRVPEGYCRISCLNRPRGRYAAHQSTEGEGQPAKAKPKVTPGGEVSVPSALHTA